MIDRINSYLWLWKLFGVCHVKLCNTGNKDSATLKPAHPAHFLYAAALFLVIVVTSIQEIILTMNSDTFAVNKGRIMTSADVGCMMCAACAGIVSTAFNRRRFLNVLLDLDKVERYLQGHLNRRNPPQQLPKFMKVSHFLVWFSMLVALGYDWCACFLVFDNDLGFSYPWTYVAYFITTTIILKFLFVVLYIRQQFETINSLFKEHLHFIYNPPPRTHGINARNHMVKSKLMIRNLTSILGVHDNLYRIIAETSIVFGPENLISLMYIFEQLVCCPFYSIVNSTVFKIQKESTTNFIVLYIIWTCSFILVLLVMVNACSKVKDEAFELKKIVSRHMNPLETSYPNDYIIAAAVTYLVIFLQF